MSEKEPSKALPFDTEKGFTSIPNAVCMYYIRHPRFNPTAERVYRYLISRHNENYGYAFPSWSAIRENTGVSQGTLKTALDSLEALGLINRENHSNESSYDNKIYTFNVPIEDEDEFNRRFGEEIEAIKKSKKPKGGSKKRE